MSDLTLGSRPQDSLVADDELYETMVQFDSTVERIGLGIRVKQLQNECWTTTECILMMHKYITCIDSRCLTIQKEKAHIMFSHRFEIKSCQTDSICTVTPVADT